MSMRLPLSACAELLPTVGSKRYPSHAVRSGNRRSHRAQQWLLCCGVCFALGIGVGIGISRSARPAAPAARSTAVADLPLVTVRSLP